MVEARDRNISDHTPLVLNTGSSTHQDRQFSFKFERGWLIRDGFFDMVANIWRQECHGTTSMQRWQNKIIRLRQYLRGWAKHTAGAYKQEKKRLIAGLDELDKKAETTILTDNEINLKYYLKERLISLLREEEINWYERAKVKSLLQGGDNTRFFHLVANGKHRKQHIFILEQEDGVIVGDLELKKYITNYYKNLFGKPDEINISLVESRIYDIPQVTDAENDTLISAFPEIEVK